MVGQWAGYIFTASGESLSYLSGRQKLKEFGNAWQISHYFGSNIDRIIHVCLQ
jgi:hypothetical protein